MNNKFLPYKEIETEAVLQLDDDVLMAPEEIEFGFRQVYVLVVVSDKILHTFRPMLISIGLPRPDSALCALRNATN